MNIPAVCSYRYAKFIADYGVSKHCAERGSKCHADSRAIYCANVPMHMCCAERGSCRRPEELRCELAERRIRVRFFLSIRILYDLILRFFLIEKKRLQLV